MCVLVVSVVSVLSYVCFILTNQTVMCMAAYHPLDTLLAWLEGIFVGMADVATTLDWENCKLPVVAETMKRIGQCACGDKAYSIPEETKSRVETRRFLTNFFE